MVPEGERWGQCIANRAFKTRVIDLVLLRLPGLLLQGRPQRRLIVDYREPAEFRFCPAAGTVQREAIPELPPMGEADLKFTRHASRHGKLVVDSIDGDSIPIALMHYEQELRRATPPPLIAVLRLELRLPGEPSTIKRKADGGARRGPTSTSTSTRCTRGSRTRWRRARAGSARRRTPGTRWRCSSRSSP